MGVLSHLMRRSYYAFKYRKNKVIFHRGSNIRKGTEFEGDNAIGYFSDYKGKMGYGSYIGDNCSINADIGKYCCIGNSVITVNGFHPANTYVSIHPAFFSTKHQEFDSYVDSDSFEEHRFIDKRRSISVLVGNDVWIGTRVTILAGTTIGDGAIIAAGAVVVKDVEPYTVYGGVPAKKIGQRFSDEQIDKLLKIRWWLKPNEWIRSHAAYFENVESFITQVSDLDD